MIRSIILTAFRNLLRNRLFSLINLAGLSVSMSLGLLIITITTEQFTFDNFHHDPDRIYRVNTMALRKDGGREPYASSPLPLAAALKEDYTFTEEVVKINSRLRGDVIFGNVNVPAHGFFTDPSFFKVFNFTFEKGDPAHALSLPNSLVLTQDAAIKIFGDQNPLGQTVTLKGYGEFQITGILSKFTSKTHFDFEIIGSTAALPLLEKEGKISASLMDWNNYYSGYIYFKAKPGVASKEIDRALEEISKKYYANLMLESRDKGYAFYLQPLGDITPGPELSNQMGGGIPMIVVAFLAFLAGVVMIMACINYTNLMIAKSLTRAREVGVRKVVGASRFQVFIQFAGEAVVFSLIALAASHLLLQILKPAFLELHITREFSAQLTENVSSYIYFLVFALAIGLMAGTIPAAYLSSFRPAAVIKDSLSSKVSGRLTLRQILTTIQFSVSLIFIILVLVIYRQIDFMINKDYGITDKDILNIRLQGMDFENLATEVQKLPGVSGIGGVSHPLGTWADRADDYRRNIDETPFAIREFIVDRNYIRQIGLQFVAGANFEARPAADQERFAIINEKALPLFHFQNALSAIGQSIYAGDSLELVIKGVVRDFHFRPLNYEIGGLVLRDNAKELEYLSVKVTEGQAASTMASVSAIWKQLDPVHPVDMKMMEEEIEEAYTDAGFKDILKVVSYVSFVAVSLACLGMLGMAMYATHARIKEIGVRKVMGASSLAVTLLLSRSFVLLIALAALIGTPVGYWLGSMFLERYPYKVSITAWMLASGIGLILVLGAITIVSQTWKAATSNPVDALKYE